VIPHLGGTPEAEYALEQCWQSLEETAPKVQKVLVINGAKCHHEHAQNASILIREQGQCKAVNAGVAITNTPWIMVTNDDMIFPPGWLENLDGFWDPTLVETVLTKPWYLCPKLIEPRPGAPTFEVLFCGGAGGDFDKQKFLDFVANEYQSKGIRRGANLPFIIKRELWETVGGYDINYDPWGSNSDSDLQYKVRLAGIQPIQQTAVTVYHFSQTSGTFLPENQSYWQRNFAYFQEKWGFARTDQGIWECNFHLPSPAEGRIYKPEWAGRYGYVY
jgi:hypothetical protein